MYTHTYEIKNPNYIFHKVILKFVSSLLGKAAIQQKTMGRWVLGGEIKATDG